MRDFSISEYKGDKLSVGGFNSGKEKSFTTKDINLLKNDMIYLFSDGFADQFGTDNKKYTTKRLKNLLLEISNKEIEEQKIIIEKVIIDWKGTAPQTDDILISGIKI